MNIINPNSTHFKAVVDSQGMQYLRDYVLLDRLQHFGIVDPNENAWEWFLVFDINVTISSVFLIVEFVFKKYIATWV